MDLVGRKPFLYAYNNGADQLAHLHSQVSNFVIGLLTSIIFYLDAREISIFQLVSVAQ